MGGRGEKLGGVIWNDCNFEVDSKLPRANVNQLAIESIQCHA